MKILIIKLCFWVIDKLINDAEIFRPDPAREKLIDELIEGVETEHYPVCTKCLARHCPDNPCSL